MRAWRLRRARFAVLALLIPGLACADLLDLEAARVDPELSAGTANAAETGGAGAGLGSAGGGGALDVGGVEGGGTKGSLPETAGAAGVAPDPEPQAPCEALCDTVLTACPLGDGATSSFAVYDSRLTCLAECSAMPLGEPEDEIGNSVYCRLNSARVAAEFPGERITACPAAGPGGDGICGDNCEGYCLLMMAQCSGVFPSYASCTSECAGVPDLGGFRIDQVTGDSIQCRLYHVSAAVVSPRNHCPHAAGAFPCTD